jgi:carboxyl-terminal processing protease
MLRRDKSRTLLTTRDKAKILDSVKKLVVERHINVRQPDQDYGKWLAAVEERRPSLLAGEDAQAFETGVRQLLQELGSSHLAFFRRDGSRIPAPYAIHASVRAVDTPLGLRWMFENVIEAGVASLAGLKCGDLLVSIDSIPAHPPAIPTFLLGQDHCLGIGSFDRHMREVIVHVPDKKAKDRPPMIEPPSLSYSLVPPDIGVLRVASFPGNIGLDFARKLDRAISDLKVRGARRLLIDLRGNVGGALGSLRLMSYLCPGKLEIGHSLTRKRLRGGYDKASLAQIDKLPTSKADMLRMFVRFRFLNRDRSLTLVTEGLGEQPFHKRTAILVDQHSKSAAETVAAFAKENQLATLVGTLTAGEVLGAANFTLPRNYCLRMPVAGWYTWHGRCIEGAGVEPDVVVENSLERLTMGIDEAFGKAVEVVKKL